MFCQHMYSDARQAKLCSRELDSCRCGVFCLLRFPGEGFEAALSRQGGAHSSQRQARFPVTLKVRLMARGFNALMRGRAWQPQPIARSRWHIEHQVPCSL